MRALGKLTKDIHALGQHLQNIGAKRVAIYLPNDIENLVATFGNEPFRLLEEYLLMDC